MNLIAAAIIAAAVWLTHYLYHWTAADPYDAMQLFYIARGFEGVLLFAALALLLTRYPLAVGACVWGIFEEAQTSVCGILWPGGPVAVDSGICLELFGYGPYAALGSAALVYLF